MNRWFGEAGLAQHPDKTFIGRIGRGFDWLGYQFCAKGLPGVSAKSIERFAAKLRRLLEQTRLSGSSNEERQRRVAEYIRRWQSATICPRGGAEHSIGKSN
ncbi:MAG TPA: hypothetical protein VIU93_11160 [Gallionellaceae bacterium]